jgi:cytochrome c biogenesis protein CcdA
MENNIEQYRSPMITAIGIILGFVLAFTATWATQLPQETDWSDYLIGIGLFVSVFLQIWALYRMLDNSVTEENKTSNYRQTLRIFILGLSFAFLGLLTSTIQTFFTPIV